ncbi:MAG TPA: hypothetical protein VHL11_00890 [Phototrophicaceae bacterium]|jgi:hypothetical protein|nr:hypothetical protein [Phototrophicaceae bacterium]
MRGLHKALLIGLTVIMLAVFALPAMAQLQTQSTTPTIDETVMIGPDAVLFRINGGIQIWVPDDNGVWYPAISQSAEDLAKLPATPDSAMRIARNGKISVYKLADGQYQVNNGLHADGKMQVVVFDSVFTYAHQYEVDIFAPTAS